MRRTSASSVPARSRDGGAVISFTDGTGAAKNPNNYTWWDLAHQADLLGLIKTIRGCTQSYISVDDDNVAIKGGAVLASGLPSAQFMTIAHNHFYSGHGMSIGSETNAGVSDILVNDLTIDGADNGLRIKSDRSRGGIVQRVAYNDVCMRNIDARNLGGGALLFSAYYTPTATGSLFPDSTRFVPFVSAGITCDANGDGKIDHDDIAAVAAAIGFSVFPGDPRDANHDGIVTGADVAACARQCKNATCAP